MATVLVDYENVYSAHGLDGAEYLNEKDTLIIFFSNPCGRIKAKYIDEILESGCHLDICKLKKTGKNALDFYIAAKCGIISQQEKTPIVIVSNDKGFKAVVDFFQEKEKGTTQVVLASDIAQGLAALSDAGNTERRRSIQMNNRMLDLEEEFSKYSVQKGIVETIKNALAGTPYEDITQEILDFAEASRNKDGHRRIYTGALHRFGRAKGTDIYHILKKVI